MDETTLPPALREAVTVKTAGATGVARLAIAGLLEIVEDRTALRAAAAFLRERLPGYAPIWHIANAVHGGEPGLALRRIRAELDEAVEASVVAATRWVVEQGGRVTAAPSSSVVTQVLADPGVREQGSGGDALVGLAGADAIGATGVLNILGTAELARRLPTLVVTTSLKLVPEAVFGRLGAPVFERIPLAAFAGVVLDGEIVTPDEAGRRAEALGE
ncbi:hypothetical protein [Sphaerisporangium corydalis]|uniref:Uncharacterized protein n=1 Tax=Sphaerisporangium corydalis TaxID=1441875 RepID=A0ABV9EJR5_9ACTN|nr:hypothetical protein [Sphaerisporangium corydalis]